MRARAYVVRTVCPVHVYASVCLCGYAVCAVYIRACLMCAHACVCVCVCACVCVCTCVSVFCMRWPVCCV